VKKIFILTGEESGDKIAYSAISKLKKINNNIEYLSVGGSNLSSLGIKSIFNLKEITYIGFTKVLINLFKIRNKINFTVDEIIKFKPDILFSVDSPEYTLRVAEKVKKINQNIKTIHYVAPQVWIWREGRIKKFKKFIDHFLLLFSFEKKYFENENIKNTFVGHPLLENKHNVKTDFNNLLHKDKKIISIFAGSRFSEVKVLLPILIDFIIMMNNKYNDLVFVFHSTNENKSFIIDELNKTKLKNVDVISDANIKLQILLKSVFAVAKSGTISLEICNARIPSIIIYKINFLNYLIMKSLVKVNFANIINIINNREVIPELLQKDCNAKEIYKSVVYFLNNPDIANKQIIDCDKTLEQIKSKFSASEDVATILNNYLNS
tara:strand:+ start:757 stop:1893 length:1137 start_codon:yes stop_codon:yes gene_type:complete